MSHERNGNDGEDAWPVVDPGSDSLSDASSGQERPDDGLENLFSRRESKSRTRGVPDFVRRAIENTMGSVQSTQNVSKEALQFFLSTTDKTRREIVRIAASEVGTFLRQSDIASEVVKILTSVEADVKVSIKFKRTERGVSPEVRTQEKVGEVSPPDRGTENS